MKTKAAKAKNQKESVKETPKVEESMSEEKTEVKTEVKLEVTPEVKANIAIVEAKEPTPTEVMKDLEVEAADSQPAPDVSMIYDHQSYLKLRTELPKQYDAKFPERIHVWAPALMDRGDLKSRGLTVILEDGDPKPHGGDVLCWMRKDINRAIRKRERERSEQSIAGLVRAGSEAKFKKKRAPKSAPGEED